MEKQNKPKKKPTQVYTNEAIKDQLTEYAEANNMSFSQLCVAGALLYIRENPIVKN